MKLVLAEKPSVGRTLAAALGCNQRGNGYLEGREYVVTWALGHLVELAQPATYGDQYRRWSLASLPILPNDLKLEPIENTKEQFKVVKSLMNRSDINDLVIATDAGREGELVARWIMELAGWTGRVERLWISSQTDEAIREGFSKLKSGDEYLNLYKAAESRSAADWYVGMNVSRALTCRYDARLSAGRVQTPTLKIMCEREDEIEKFQGSFYWTIKADFNLFKASLFITPGSIRITEEKEALRLNDLLKGKTGKVSSVTKIQRRDAPPLAYDLTELQRDANITLGFSAKKTLDVLQKLYEVHKIITYPRTDSRYITHDIVPTFGKRLMALAATPLSVKAAPCLAGHIREDLTNLVQDDKVSDHHALLPTEQRVDLRRLNKDEKDLWTLVVTRFLETLYPDYVYNTTTIEIEVEQSHFQSRMTSIVDLGYKKVKGLQDKSENAYLTNLKEGDSVTIKDIELKRLAQDSPLRYNDATLLSAMEHAGRFVEDEDAKKNLGAGLGTPATRADIIEKLVHNGYITRNENNELVPTARGREVVRLAPSLLQSPELTGKWEDRLSSISKGKEDAANFISDIKETTRELVKQIEASRDSFAPSFPEAKECPYCHSLMMKIIDEEGATHFVCQKLSCGYEEKVVVKKVPLTQKELEVKKKELEKQGKTMVTSLSAHMTKARPAVHPVRREKVRKVSQEDIKKAETVSSSASYFSQLTRHSSLSSETDRQPESTRISRNKKNLVPSAEKSVTMDKGKMKVVRLKSGVKTSSVVRTNTMGEHTTQEVTPAKVVVKKKIVLRPKSVTLKSKETYISQQVTAQQERNDVYVSPYKNVEEIEIVRPSRKSYQRNNSYGRNDTHRDNNSSYSLASDTKHRFDKSQATTTTFADLLNAHTKRDHHTKK